MSNSLYLHVDNGGYTFTVDDRNGPTVSVSSNFFGQKTGEVVMHTTKESLQKLGEFFLAVSRDSFSPDYLYAAEAESECNATCGECGCDD